MGPVSWLETMADGSPVTLFLMVLLALFVDSLAVIGALLPGDLLLLAPAAAVGSSAALIVIVAGATGTVLGYTVSYAVGRRAGPAIRSSWLGQRVGEHRWKRAERLLRGPAGRALALVQFMPVLNYLVPLLAGTLRVPLLRFVRLVGLGAVAYSTVYVTLGVMAGGTGQAIGDSTGRLVALLVIAAVAGALSMTVMARAVHRMTAEQSPEQTPVDFTPVDEGPQGVAHCSSCSTATAFSTGTGPRCP